MKKDLINQAMQTYFQGDTPLINHALKVLEYSERLIEVYEDSCNREVITYAALLHDIGIPEAQRKYDNGSGKYQQIEGPPIARDILELHNIQESIIAEVCQIIAHHHTPGIIDTVNFHILYDADWLVNLPNVHGLDHSPDKLMQLIEETYLTALGKDLARAQFLD